MTVFDSWHERHLFLALQVSTHDIDRIPFQPSHSPPTMFADALHVAVAALHNVDYLLTWNCRHLANPHLQKRLREFMAGHGLLLPEICTPSDFTGD